VLSTDAFGGAETSRILIPLLRACFPNASPAELQHLHDVVRKLAHFAEYLVLGVLLYRALAVPGRSASRAAVTALALAAFYSLIDELHQSFVPGRTGALADCAIDVAGAGAGLALVTTWVAARRSTA
jgi:VanZ family protein